MIGMMEIRIGAHRVAIEEDVLVAYVDGPWLLPEMVEFLALCEKTRTRCGSVYIITVVGPGYSLPPDSRKYIAEWSRRNLLTGNVVAGAPFAMRALIGILSRASKLVGSHSSEVTFTATEAEARAWVAQRKQQRPGQTAPH